MISRLKTYIPSGWLDIYHAFLSKLAAFWYNHPSREMVVIGVTGTNGKTTTAYMIAKALEAGGHKTGCTTTALFKVGDREWLNDKKMTMLGRFASQKLLRMMADAGCEYAVIETSSQGIVQHRHQDIAYDVGVFTNLTPEHIEAHGGFENYKKAKLELFRHISKSAPKSIKGKNVPKIFVLNADDEHAKDFAAFGADQIIWFGLGEKAEVRATDVKDSFEGTSFALNGKVIRLKIMGEVNVMNALAALAAAKSLGIDSDAVSEKLSAIKNVPGRFEMVDEGQPWFVMVDYAPEPESLGKVYGTISKIRPNNLIHVLGSCGGGRDAARRPVLGRMAGENAKYVIVTNEDPYDDDPLQIMEQVAAGAESAGKKKGEDLFVVPDRREAIGKAMSLATAGDLVLMTGKGSEQAICLANGKKMPWDERSVAREAIRQSIAERALKA